jgi:hypothetical protein
MMLPMAWPCQPAGPCHADRALPARLGTARQAPVGLVRSNPERTSLGGLIRGEIFVWFHDLHCHIEDCVMLDNTGPIENEIA